MAKIFVSVDHERFEADLELVEQLKIDQAQLSANKTAIEESIALKESAKISAMSKLTALGLTQQEAEAVIGL